ncbi:bactofilin family protein [Flagellimonas marinaquae]
METSKIPTIVAEKTRVTGDIAVAGDLKVAGHIEGGVIVSGKVIVAESGRIFGNVEAMEANIFGKVNGDICVSGLLRIEASASVVGDLKYESVAIEVGGKIRGSFQPLKEDEKKSFIEKHNNIVGDKINGLSVVRGSQEKVDSNVLENDMGETAHW